MKIALIGFYGKNNFGDCLMEKHLRSILSKDNNEVVVYSDCDVPNVINAEKDNSYLQADLIVIGGGGIVVPEFCVLYKTRIQSLIDCKKPICFLNVNVTTVVLENIEFGNKIKQLNATWYVRDYESVEILKKLDIQSNFLPDVSFAPDIISTNKHRKKNLLIFLNGYAWANILTGPTDKVLLAQKNIIEIGKYLDWMTLWDWNIKLVPCQTEGMFDDRIVHCFLYSVLNNKNKCTLILDRLTPEEIIQMIETSSFVLSARYHPSVLAVASGTPLLDITHHDKNKKFLETVNMQANSLDFYLFHKELLIEKTKSIEAQPAHIIEILNFKNLWEKFQNEWGKAPISIENIEYEETRTKTSSQTPSSS